MVVARQNPLVTSLYKMIVSVCRALSAYTLEMTLLQKVFAVSTRKLRVAYQHPGITISHRLHPLAEKGECIGAELLRTVGGKHVLHSKRTN